MLSLSCLQDIQVPCAAVLTLASTPVAVPPASALITVTWPSPTVSGRPLCFLDSAFPKAPCAAELIFLEHDLVISYVVLVALCIIHASTHGSHYVLPHNHVSRSTHHHCPITGHVCHTRHATHSHIIYSGHILRARVHTRVHTTISHAIIHHTVCYTLLHGHTPCFLTSHHFPEYTLSHNPIIHERCTPSAALKTWPVLL